MTAEPTGARILVVANRTAGTQMLFDEVTRRGQDGAHFTLVIPPEHGADRPPDWTKEDAVRALARRAREDVGFRDAGDDPLVTIHQAVDNGEVDELIISVAEEHLHRWRHHDLAYRLEHLGLPVTVIAHDPAVGVSEYVKRGLPGNWGYATSGKRDEVY